MKVMNTIQENPKSGAIGTITSFLVGMIPNVEPSVQTTVIFWFQVLAFTVSILVGIFTIIGFVRKWKLENKIRKESINN